MTDPAALDAEKAAAARAAAALVEPGMLVGLGTGSTAAHLIAALGERVRQGLSIRTVCTSLRTEEAAHAAGLAPLDFADVPQVDLTIDGVDEVDPGLRAIKGGGGAMLREKIVAEASTRMIAIADSSKPVARLARAVPIEVLPFARSFIAGRIEALGGLPDLRRAGDALYRTDAGNLVIDAAFGAISDPERLAAELTRIPGMLGHGLFLTEIDSAIIAHGTRVERVERPA